MVPKSSSAARGRSPAVGSSSSSRSGAFISAIAMARTWRWPPVSVRGRRAPLLGQHRKALVELGDARRARRAVEIAAHLEVLGDAHRAEDVALLRHEGQAEPAELGRAEARDVAVLEHDLARAGRNRPGDQLEQRRLAGAVRADEGDDLARRRRAATRPSRYRRRRRSRRRGRRCRGGSCRPAPEIGLPHAMSARTASNVPWVSVRPRPSRHRSQRRSTSAMSCSIRSDGSRPAAARAAVRRSRRQGRVDAGGGLVEQQQGRFRHQRAPDLEEFFWPPESAVTGLSST